MNNLFKTRKIFFGSILLSFLFGFFLPNQGLFLKPYIIYLLAALLTLNLLKIDSRKFLIFLEHPNKILKILFLSHFLTPFLVFIFRPFLDPQVYLGLIIAASIPVGVMVVFLSNLYQGDTEESLVMTGISHLLAPALVPLSAFIFAGNIIKLDVKGIFWLIFELIFIPFLLSRLIHFFKGIRTFLEKETNYFSDTLIFLIIWPVIASLKDYFLTDSKLLIFLSIIILFCLLFTFFIGFKIGQDLKEKITFSICGSNKNFTLALVIAFSYLGPKGALGPAIYTALNSLFFVFQGSLINFLKKVKA